MKKLLVFISILITLIPSIVFANNVNEYPPYINFKNSDKFDYEKIIDEKFVTVRVKSKTDKTYYSWSFDKNKVGNSIDIDFDISFDTDKEIEGMVKDAVNIKYLTFTHHGDLPSKAKVTVYVGDKFKNKDSLYLYYYNEEKKEIEYVDKNIKVSDGYIEFEIEHCSKYFVTTYKLDNINIEVSKKSVNYLLLGLIILALLSTVYILEKNKSIA